jgi:hypothetical protein
MPSSTERQQFRQTVAAIADKARAKLPACTSRIDSAVKLVLLGEVTLHADGTATVGSCTDPTRTYTVNGCCDCQDFARAPGQLCKHRLAYGIARRAAELLPPAPEVIPPAPAPLGEAPASVNVHLELAGRQVQLTLRDADEGRLLARLETVLQRFPIPETAAEDTRQCPRHHVPMQVNHKDGRSWWSHRTAQGWCKGR